MTDLTTSYHVSPHLTSFLPQETITHHLLLTAYSDSGTIPRKKREERGKNKEEEKSRKGSPGWALTSLIVHGISRSDTGSSLPKPLISPNCRCAAACDTIWGLLPTGTVVDRTHVLKSLQDTAQETNTAASAAIFMQQRYPEIYSLPISGYKTHQRHSTSISTLLDPGSRVTNNCLVSCLRRLSQGCLQHPRQLLLQISCYSTQFLERATQLIAHHWSLSKRFPSPRSSLHGG